MGALPGGKLTWDTGTDPEKIREEQDCMRTVATDSSSEDIGPITADRPLGNVLEFLRALWGVNHALESSSRRMKARLGVTGPERMVVRLVGRYPMISAGELARILRVHPSTLTGLLKRLVARGVLSRGVDSVDGRRALFTLTNKGAAVDRVTGGTVEAALRVALGAIPTRDVRAVAEVLEVLRRKLEPGRGDERPTPAPRVRGSNRRGGSPSRKR